MRELNRLRLVRLGRCLEKYSDTLIDWECALDEAADKVARFSQSERDNCAVEIRALKKSRSEFATVKLRVDDGWAMYRSLLVKAKLNEPGDTLPTIN